ncbi:MAG: hypothetical protein NTZ37_06620 [Methanoregula sp.]|nr:hypothetical protein [Methanoregula sp.]
MPRCRHVRDLPAVAARVRIDRSHARNHCIENVLRRVMLRALMGEKSGWDGHTTPAPRAFSRTPLL